MMTVWIRSHESPWISIKGYLGGLVTLTRFPHFLCHWETQWAQLPNVDRSEVLRVMHTRFGQNWIDVFAPLWNPYETQLPHVYQVRSPCPKVHAYPVLSKLTKNFLIKNIKHNIWLCWTLTPKRVTCFSMDHLLALYKFYSVCPMCV